MPPFRWSSTCAALLLASAPGCTGGGSPSGAKLALYPIVNERGLVTYVTRDPYDPAAERERLVAQEQQREAAEVARQREERNLQALMEQRRRQNEATERVLRQLRQQSDEWTRQLRSRPQPTRWQGNPDVLRGGEVESMRLQRESQAVDRALQDLQRGQAEYGLRK